MCRTEKRISDELFTILKKVEEIYTNRNDEYKHHVNVFSNTDFFEIDFQYDLILEPLQEEVLNVIDMIYQNANDQNIYFFDCSFKVYKNLFEGRKENYFKNNQDANNLDFINSEVEYFSNPKENRVFKENETFYYHDYFETKECYAITLKRKLEFLNNILIEYNYQIDLSEFKIDNIDFKKIKMAKTKNKEHQFDIKRLNKINPFFNNISTNTKSHMYLRTNDNTLTGLITTSIYREITKSTNNKPQEIGIELNAIENDKKKIKYCEKEAIKLSKKLYETPDDLERLQAIDYLQATKGYNNISYALIDGYCKSFTHNLPTSFYEKINVENIESLVKSNSHPNSNTIIEDISKINKLSDLENSYQIKSIKNFKNYMVIAIEVQIYKLAVLDLKSSEIKNITVAQTKTKPKLIYQSFTYIKSITNTDTLKNLKSSLEVNDFIEKDAKWTDFRRIFSGKEVKSKIIWNGKESLVYFIRQLKKLKLIKPVKEIWKISVNCFIDSDGNEFEAVNLNGQKKPSDTSKIDRIINNLKKEST